MTEHNPEWEQGSILTYEDALLLGLIDSSEKNKYVIIITHDCDLANKDEPFIEVIIGVGVAKHDSRYTSNKSPRCLHLKLLNANSNEFIFIELRHTKKCQVDKQKLLESSKDLGLVLTKEEKRSLKLWLASRYGRPAFPNAFETKLRKKIKNKEVIKYIEKILEPAAQHLVGLFFELGEDRFNELEAKPYLLTILVVYNAAEGGQSAREAAESVAKQIKDLFFQAYGDEKTATEIVLEQCTAIADLSVTLADLRKIDQWRLEYLSLRESPIGELIAIDQQPA